MTRRSAEFIRVHADLAKDQGKALPRGAGESAEKNNASAPPREKALSRPHSRFRKSPPYRARFMPDNYQTVEQTREELRRQVMGETGTAGKPAYPGTALVEPIESAGPGYARPVAGPYWIE